MGIMPIIHEPILRSAPEACVPVSSPRLSPWRAIERRCLRFFTSGALRGSSMVPPAGIEPALARASLRCLGPRCLPLHHEGEFWWARGDLNPQNPDPKSGAYTSFATGPYPGEELNLHAFRRPLLRRMCLPVPPPGRLRLPALCGFPLGHDVHPGPVVVAPLLAERGIVLLDELRRHRHQVMQEPAGADPDREEIAVAVVADRSVRMGDRLPKVPLEELRFCVFHAGIVSDPSPQFNFGAPGGSCTRIPRLRAGSSAVDLPRRIFLVPPAGVEPASQD